MTSIVHPARTAEHQDIGEARPSSTLWLFIIVMTAVSLAVSVISGVGVATAEIVAVFAGSALLLALSAFYTVSRPDPRLARLTRGAAELTLLISMIGTLSFSGASIAMPLRDDWYHAWDQALGFDWRYWLSVLDSRPNLHAVLAIAYHSMLPQTAAAILTLALTGSFRRLDRFLMSYGIAAVITVAIAAIAPALSPIVHLGITAADHPNIVLAVPLEFEQQARALRDGSLKMIELGGAQGLVTFPSFHTVSAVLLMLGFAAVPYARWIGFGLNAIMLLAIPIEGSHYLVDVIAGAAVALLSWKVAGRLLCLKARRPRVQRL